MSDFASEVLDAVGGDVARELSQRVGLSDEQAREALRNLTPVVLGGLKRQQEKMGESEFQGMLESLNQFEADADDVSASLERSQAEGRDDATLGGLLKPDEADQTTMAFTKNLNVNGELARQLIAALGPVIVGMLVKKARSGGGGRGSNTGGGLAGGITSILDRDGDGSVLDDLAGMLFQNAGGGQMGGKGGFLAWLLTLLFGRR